MPTYSFECKQCGTGHDVVRPMSLAAKGCRCPSCRRLMERIFQAPQVIDDQLPSGKRQERLSAFPNPDGSLNAPVVDSRSGKKALVRDINARFDKKYEMY